MENSKNPIRKKRCGRCDFFENLGEGDGYCFRYPPVFIGTKDDLWNFPDVNASDVCGEWKIAKELT
jgi:hypothetical protein